MKQLLSDRLTAPVNLLAPRLLSLSLSCSLSLFYQDFRSRYDMGGLSVTCWVSGAEGGVGGFPCEVGGGPGGVCCLLGHASKRPTGGRLSPVPRAWRCRWSPAHQDCRCYRTLDLCPHSPGRVPPDGGDTTPAEPPWATWMLHTPRPSVRSTTLHSLDSSPAWPYD